MAANGQHSGARDGDPTARTRRRRNPPAAGVRQQIRPLRWLVSVLAFVLVPVALLALIGLGVIYVRLSQGPVSLSYLRPAIERQIAEKLGGVQVDVKDVVLSLANQGAEFQLSDVRVRDADGGVVAQAPLAAMQIDRMALFWGQISPSGIVLIRPQMRLAYSEGAGLSLSFERASPSDGGSVPSRPVALLEPAQGGLTSNQKNGDAAWVGRPDEASLMRSMAAMLRKLRTSYEVEASVWRGLDRLGVRNALIEVDYDGRTSRFGVPSGDLEIRHRPDRSVVSGLTTIVPTEGQNVVLSFQAAAIAATRTTELKGSIRDLQPSALVGVLPELSALGRITAQISAEARFNLNPSGDVIDGAMTVEAGGGSVDVGYAKTTGSVALEHGRIALRLGAGSRDVIVEPSTLSWGGGNELQVAGKIVPSDAAGSWAFDLTSVRGHFVNRAGGDERQPVQQWSMAGRVLPAKGDFYLDQGLVDVAGGRVLLKGMAGAGSGVGDGARLSIEGRIGPGPLSALAYLWPAHLAPDAHEWVRLNVASGQMTGGEFARSWSAGGAGAQPSDEASLVVRGRDVKVVTPLGQLPVHAPKALLRLSGRQLEVTVPSATLMVQDARSLTLRQLQFEVADVWLDDAVGDLSFKVAGKLQDGLAVVAAAGWRAKLPPGAMATLEKNASGRLDGRLNIAVPLHGGPRGELPVVTGKISIADARAKDALAGHDVSGGRFNFNLAEKSINADGDMLVAGVATKLTWQYILDAPLESQPPIRLEASLDEADRTRLGIKINHIVRGVADVAINLIPLKDGGFGSKVRADLTKASIAVDSLAWVKPAGRQTLVEFDAVADKTYHVLLDNLQVAGDGVAIKGRAMLDRDYQLKSFELPQFSIDRVTRLEIRGQLGKGSVWKVTVSGQTFEGRALFRSLFQAGRARGQGPVPDAQQMGIDLEANIATVLGFWNSKLSNVRMSLSKRGGKTQSMQLEGRLEGDELLKAAVVRGTGQRRELHAFSSDAGRAFALVGFYPNAQSGRLELVVNLDGQGAADTAGILLVRKFQIRGDEVVGQLATAPRDGIRRRRAAQRAQSTTQTLAFDWMRVPFFIGNGQFILQGAELRGPVVGATIEGKADFEARTLDLSGTYVPLQGLNGALGGIPGLGQILAGPNGEGVLGMKFALRGPMSQPEMLVNPLSMMAPGIFREMFQISNPSLEVTKRTQAADGEDRPAPGQARKRRGNWRNGAFEAN